MEAIEVEEIAFTYEKKFSILEGLSFKVPKGQFIGVFGPNGAGKTTLLKLLLGLLKPTHGKIRVLGKTPKQARTKVGYVPQVRRFDRQFPISVLEVVLQGCLADHKGWGGFSPEAKDRALDALEKVRLQDKANASFGTLSGGQIQRTLIARALASEPEILLLDEATVGIDPKTLREIQNILLEMRNQITILLVTHDLNFLAKEMDRLLYVNRNATFYNYEQLCGHFAMGLYHPGGNRGA